MTIPLLTALRTPNGTGSGERRPARKRGDGGALEGVLPQPHGTSTFTPGVGMSQ